MLELLAYLEFTTMIALLNNAVLDGKLLDQVPLDFLLGPLGTLLEDVVGGPKLVVEDRAGETLQDFLLYKTMHKPFVDEDKNHKNIMRYSIYVHNCGSILFGNIDRP
mgnify:CR=1 FL=1